VTGTVIPCPRVAAPPGIIVARVSTKSERGPERHVDTEAAR
jgi:hypothetical protein